MTRQTPQEVAQQLAAAIGSQMRACPSRANYSKMSLVDSLFEEIEDFVSRGYNLTDAYRILTEHGVVMNLDTFRRYFHALKVMRQSRPTVTASPAETAAEPAPQRSQQPIEQSQPVAEVASRDRQESHDTSPASAPTSGSDDLQESSSKLSSAEAIRQELKKQGFNISVRPPRKT